MPVSTPNTSQGTIEVDALVVGAGAAGMTAALVASLEGSGYPAPGRVAKPVLPIMSPTPSDISRR